MNIEQAINSITFDQLNQIAEGNGSFNDDQVTAVVMLVAKAGDRALKQIDLLTDVPRSPAGMNLLRQVNGMIDNIPRGPEKGQPVNHQNLAKALIGFIAVNSKLDNYLNGAQHNESK